MGVAQMGATLIPDGIARRYTMGDQEFRQSRAGRHLVIHLRK